MINSPYAPQNNFGQINQASNVQQQSPGSRFGQQNMGGFSGGASNGQWMGGNTGIGGGPNRGEIRDIRNQYQQNYGAPTNMIDAAQQSQNTGWTGGINMGSGLGGQQQGMQLQDSRTIGNQQEPGWQAPNQQAWQGIDPRLANLYQAHGIMTPGARGSGFSDAAYWNDKVGSAGWDYISNRLGADLGGTGTDQPGPGDVGNLSGRNQQMMGQAGSMNQMGPQNMQQLMQMIQTMRPMQQARNVGTSLALGSYGPQQQQPNMDVSSFLGR